MSDKKFQVPPGQIFDLTLKRKPRPAPPRPPASAPPSGLIAAEGEPTRYVFRGKKGSLRIFDLSFVLTSKPETMPATYRVALDEEPPVVVAGAVNEYIQLDLIAPIAVSSLPSDADDSLYVRIPIPNSPDAAALKTDLWKLDKALLGRLAPDPHTNARDVLGSYHTNATGKLMPAVALVNPEKGETVLPDSTLPGAWIEVVLLGGDGDFDNVTATSAQKKFERAEGETWGAINLSDNLAPFTGEYKPSGKKWTSIQSNFDTSDAGHTKLTSEPDYFGEEATLPEFWEAPLDIYIAPQLSVPAKFNNDGTGSFTVGDTIQPDLPLRRFADFETFFPGYNLFEDRFPDITILVAWPRQLLAIIRNKGERLFYVWRRE